EIVPTLRSLRESFSRTKLVLGLRDILDEASEVRAAWDQDGTYELLEDIYDLILVYGQRDVFDPTSEYELSSAVAAKTRFVGYLVRPPNTRPAGDHRTASDAPEGAAHARRGPEPPWPAADDPPGGAFAPAPAAGDQRPPLRRRKRRHQAVGHGRASAGRRGARHPAQTAGSARASARRERTRRARRLVHASRASRWLNDGSAGRRLHPQDVPPLLGHVHPERGAAA